MSDDLRRVAQLIARDMAACAQAGQDLRTFAGMGFALQRVFEVATGRSGRDLSGSDILSWAENLSQPSIPDAGPHVDPVQDETLSNRQTEAGHEN